MFFRESKNVIVSHSERKELPMQRLQNRTLVRINPENGDIAEVGLRLVPHDWLSGFKYIVSNDESEALVGVIEHERSYLLGDVVKITADPRGYICPGISCPGRGKITEIQEDDTDHFYGVQMDNGEFGFMKSARIKVIE